MDQLKTGLMRFVEREMRSQYGDSWQEMITDIPHRDGWVDYWDVQKLLLVMWDQWAKVFSQILSHTERSLVSELRATRNQWAHQKPFSTNDTLRALDSTARLLNAISASDEHAEVEKMWMDLLRLQFEEMRRNEMRKSSFQPTEGKPMGGLKPWREVITPHPYVASGRYQQAEFAADLWQVYLGEGSDHKVRNQSVALYTNFHQILEWLFLPLPRYRQKFFIRDILLRFLSLSVSIQST